MAVSQRTDVGGQKPIFQRVCGMELLSLPQEALGAKTVATFRKHALKSSAPRSLLEPRYQLITDDFNCARYRTGQAPGHYESYFQRANHPAQPLAFWVRYTIFSPTGRPQDAIGELWAVVFNASTGRHVVAKTEVPFDRCTFSNDRFAVRIADWSWLPEFWLGAPGRLQTALCGTWVTRATLRRFLIYLSIDMKLASQKRRLLWASQWRISLER